MNRKISAVVAFAAVAAAGAVHDVTSFGAKADGTTDSTAAIQTAIDRAAAAGGGTALIPGGGVYRTYTLHLKSNVELKVDRGATLRGGDDPLKYPLFPPTDVWRRDRPMRWNARAMFYAVGQTNVAVTGGGTIDGNAKSETFHQRVNGVWTRMSDTEIPGKCMMFMACRDVRLRDFRLVDPTGWATWFLDCDAVQISGLAVHCDRERPNGDGLHFGGCRDVTVTDCILDTQDDAIIIRSHQEQMRAPRPCERVTIANCSIRSNQGAIRIGWTGDAPVKDCLFSNIVCPYTRRGILFSVPKMFDPEYTRDPPRGNGIPVPDFPTVPFAVENFRFDNVQLTSHCAPIVISVAAGERVAHMKNVSFSNCRFVSQMAPIFKFRPQDNISNWRFSNVEFAIEKPRGALTAETGVLFDNGKDITFDNVKWTCIPRDLPEWHITMQQIANGSWERVRDPRTNYGILRKAAKPHPPAPFMVPGARQYPTVEELAGGVKRYVYETLTDGGAVWRVKVVLEERSRPDGTEWRATVENNDPSLKVVGFEGPVCEYGDLRPGYAAIRVGRASVTNFPTSGQGLSLADKADKPGWYSCGDRAPRRHKEADVRCSEERGRAVYVSAFGPSANLTVRMPKRLMEAASGGDTNVLRRFRVRYDHEFGTADVGFEYRAEIAPGGRRMFGPDVFLHEESEMPSENYGHWQGDLQFSLPTTRTRNTVPRAADADCGWIQAEIDRVAAAGGGRVTIPPGVHETGSIRLRSHVELHLEKGAVISGSARQEDYDDMPEDVCPITPEFSAKALVMAWDAEDVAITGEGTIDGNGPQFYDRSKWVRNNPKFWRIPQGPRPRLVQFARCKNVRLEGATFKDSAAFTMYLRECEGVTMDRIAVIGDLRITNGDGVDLDGCRRVRIGNSTFRNGDDCFALRAIRSRKEPPRQIVCEDVVVSNCVLNSACQAIRIGCPSDDTIRNVLFKDIRLEGSNNGIYFGNHLYCLKDIDEGFLDAHDITFENFTGFQGNSAAQILVDDGIRVRRISEIVFRNFDVSSGKPLRFKSTVRQPIGNVTLENFKVKVGKGTPVEAVGIDGLIYKNVTLNGKKQPDGPVAAAPGSSAPLVRKPPITWDCLN